VIGKNTLIVRGSILGSAPAEALGFAFPSNLARMIVEQQIMQRGYFSRAYLGIHMQPIRQNIAKACDFPVERGVNVTEVERNGPAGRNNLQPGNIITNIVDIALDEEHTFVIALFAFQPGETETIEILRGDSAILIQVTFGETMLGLRKRPGRSSFFLFRPNPV